MVRIITVFIFILPLFSFAEEPFFKDCEYENKIETKIKFVIPNSLSKNIKTSNINNKLERYISYSNKVLENSCIPLKRSIDAVEYIDDSAFWPEDVYAMRSWLEYFKPSVISDQNGIYTVVLFSSMRPTPLARVCGETDMYHRDFIMLSLDCPDFVMEHELGHTMLAQHSKKQFVIENQLTENTFLLDGLVKNYAFGFVCSGHGTIMTYEPVRIPVYSSPMISYKGMTCGIPNKADNRRQVLNWIKSNLK